MSTLELRSVRKSFDQTTVIPGVDLQVDHGEFVVFVGPSGCGKSTLLRLIAGLDAPSGGEILIDGESVIDVGAADRGCAMVFQSYALYPHMTVYANMAFGLENARVPRADIREKVRQAAALLRLDQLLERKPTQLSGDSASAWRSAARSCAIPRYSCSTNPCPIWMRSCGSPCAPNCAICTNACGRP